MNNLVVIGNGFDVHHGLDTHYVSFGLFLKRNYSTIYDHLTEFYGFSEITEDSDDEHILWCQFEKSLALLDADSVLEAHSDSLASPGSPEFRDRDWNTFAIDIELIVEELTVNLFQAFKEFILSVNYPTSDLIKDKILPLSKDDKYLNFNYTNTLEHYYGIREENILYIHEKAKRDDKSLVLGHGIDPEKFNDKEPKPPEGLTDEELEHWQDCMNEKYDHSYELGKQEIHNYFIQSFKSTKSIINKNSDLFESLDKIESITILGHSLSDVDIPYFNKIKESVNSSVKWNVSYYKDSEKVEHKEALINISVNESNINLFRINELLR